MQDKICRDQIESGCISRFNWPNQGDHRTCTASRKSGINPII